MTSFDDFMKSAWKDHADNADQVAARLAESGHVIENAGQIPRYAGLVTHVYGEHLGQWPRGVEVLQSLRRLHDAELNTDACGAITRGVAALRYGGGDTAALEALNIDDRTSVLATVSSAMLGQKNLVAAVTTFDAALDQARHGLATGSPAVRALAIGGNNLAAALEGKRDRTPAETAAMLRAAEAALQYWKQAGTWLEEVRAFYRLTRSLLQAGRYTAAAAAAQQCLDVCARNDAPEFERFFGHAVLALALRAAGDAAGFAAARARALASHARVPADEQPWCSLELGELGA
ncbi:MAG: hypothetical protein ABIO63_09525 [Casimicrobiaceae bacterium]